MNLAAHEREADAEFEEKAADVLEQPAVEVALARVGPKREEVERVGILE